MLLFVQTPPFHAGLHVSTFVQDQFLTRNTNLNFILKKNSDPLLFETISFTFSRGRIAAFCANSTLSCRLARFRLRIGPVFTRNTKLKYKLDCEKKHDPLLFETISVTLSWVPS